MLLGQEIYLFSKSSRTHLGADGQRGLVLRGQSGERVRLTFDHLTPKLRMSGTRIPLPLLAYMRCIGTSHLHMWAVLSVTYFKISLQTYILTPRSRVLFETLTGSQLVKKFPAFYGTRRFITAFTKARHLFQS